MRSAEDLRTVGRGLDLSEHKGSTTIGLWVLPCSPRHVGQDLRGKRNVCTVSPAPPVVTPGLGIFL